MKKIALLFLSLSVLSAYADFDWPTANVGKDGNMASNGEDGWNGGMPDGSSTTTWFYGAGTYTSYLNTGSEFYLSSAVTLRNRSSVDESHVTLDVSGEGTHLIFRNLTMGDGGDRADSTMKIYAHDGAKVSVTNQLNSRGKNCYFDFRDGAVFDVSKVTTSIQNTPVLTFGETGGNYTIGLGNLYNVTNRFLFSNAKLVARRIYFGYGASWEFSPSFLYATNSVFEFSSTAFMNCHGVFSFKDCAYSVASNAEARVFYGANTTFDGGTVMNGKWRVGFVGAKDTVDPPMSSLTFKGGVKALVQGVASSGNYASCLSRIEITGEGTDVEIGTSSAYGDNDIGVSGSCTLKISDGAVFRTGDRFNGGMPIRFGVNDGSYGEFCVDGGTFSAKRPYGFWLGNKGVGAFYMKDGLAEIDRLIIGYDVSTSDEPSLLEQTGGTLIVGDGKEIDTEDGNLVLARSSHLCKVALNGGVLEAGIIRSVNPDKVTFSVNGGTLRMSPLNYTSAVTKKYFLYNLPAVQCGEKGIVIDSNGKDITIDNDFKDVSETGSTMVKTGKGTLVFMNDSYDLASTVVEDGTLRLGDATSVLPTDLAVTNGAGFSLAGDAAEVSLKSLVVDNGTIEIDAGDKITVEGSLRLNRLKVTFSTLPTTDEEFEFLVVGGELSADSQKALRRAYVTNVLEDGTHGALSFVYDETTAKTTIKIAVKTDVPLTEATEWRGTDGAWSSEDNWSAGLPGATKVAVFTNDSAAADVTLPSGAIAGALLFGGKNYTLSGPALSVPSEEGAAAVSVTSGSHRITAPLSIDVPLLVQVATNSTFELSGAVDGGGIVKTGVGKLVLKEDNAFLRPLSLKEGVTSVATSGALGSSDESDNLVNLIAGTLEITNDTGSEVVLEQDLRIAGADRYEPIILKNEVDTTVNSLMLSQGALLKHGKGRLTLPAQNGRVIAPYDWRADASYKPMSYSGNGSVDPKSYVDGSSTIWYYAPLTVSEGELLLKGDAANRPVETANGCVIVGRYLGEGLAGDSTLTLENVDLEMKSKRLYLGFAMEDGKNVQSATLKMVNSDILNVGDFIIGECCRGLSKQVLAMTNSSVKATCLYLSGMNSRPKSCTVLAKDSTLLSSTISTRAASLGEFDNCIVGAATGAKLSVDSLKNCYTWGGYTFRNGSVLNVNAIENMHLLRIAFEFEFEDAVWKTDSSITFDSTSVTKYFKVTSSGKNKSFTLDVGEEATFAFSDTVPLTGEGGFTKAGAGTVSFGSGMYQAEGVLKCEEGVLDFSAAGTISGVTIAPGGGVIEGATFENVVIALDGLGGEVPTFKNCTFTGRTRIVVSGEAQNAQGVPIVAYEGTLSGIDTFRLSGWNGYSGKFTAKDGTLSADIAWRGTTIIIR